MNSNSGTLQQNPNFGRNVQKSLIQSNIEQKEMQPNNALLLGDKYSSLINKSVASVGWNTGQQTNFTPTGGAISRTTA